MSSKKRLRLEKLEHRCNPTTICSASPTYEAECNYLDNLITPSMITDTAVRSGNWSDPATWGGRLPGNGDNVWIPNGITVTVDGQEPGSLHSILDNGLLTFAPNVNTSLLVDTIVVGTDNNPTGLPEGELDIGTTASPIQPGVTATVTFADDGTLTQAWPNDPQQMARGLISMNTASIVGSFVTPYEQITSGFQAGSDRLTLASTPTDWHVGDVLLLPGASATADQDEQITIQSINGNVVNLSSPLAYSHATPAGQPVYVDDEHRNVVFQSQNTTDYERFGAIMFMHTDQEVFENAALLHLGRTNKSLPLGATNPDGTINVVGRYALHFHRDYWPTLSENDPPILVSGNFEMGSPGWGYDNHSSNVDFEDNVAFQNNGAGFVTEAGNEIGTFNANMAVRTTTTVANPTSFFTALSRQAINDFGFTGSGFWMQSPSVSLTNNIALDNVVGYQFYTESLTSTTLGGSTFNGNGQIDAWTRQATTSTPLAGFSNNLDAESIDGADFFWVLTVPSGQQSIVSGFTVWDVTGDGIDNGYDSSNIVVENSSFTAAASSSGTGIFAQPAYGSSFWLLNDYVVGFALGANAPTIGTNLVEGGYWDDKTAFEVTAQGADTSSNRVVSYSNPVFGPAVVTQYQWDPQAPYEANYPFTDFVPQQVYIDGVEQYFSNQGADFVPFPTLDHNEPAALVGLTNAQMMQIYGLAMEGQIASQQPPFYYKLNSHFEVTSPTYTLSYYTPTGIVTETSPVTLQPGWNLLTRIINGAPHSWIVGYSDGNTAPPPAGGASGYQFIGSLPRVLPITVTQNRTTLEATGTSSPNAIIEVITINGAGTTWVVEQIGTSLYVFENGQRFQVVSVHPAGTYSFDVVLNASLGVTINGTKYL